MNILALTVLGAATLAFGPAFLVQAGIGYVAGTFAGAYCESRMKKLHCEISKHTGNKASEIDGLGKYAVKASQIGGLVCPVIPFISVGVGMYCSRKADKLNEDEYDAKHVSQPYGGWTTFTPGCRPVVKAGGRI